MEFCLTHAYHQDPRIFRMHEMADHAYFIPYTTAEQSRQPREQSDRFFSLCGQWKFRYEPSLYDLPDFYQEGFDDEAFEQVCVPETWQTHGADYAQYIPSAYPFIFDPPYVPERNPAAAYVKDFDFDPADGRRYELHFEGKDSCIYVWLNGIFVGYGEAPHQTSVFDVTDKLREGKNRLCVAVLKWCSGSYLDDQDKIRLSGLFREVYLLERAPQGVQDFHITVKMDGSYAVDVKAAAPVSVQIMDGSHIVSTQMAGKIENVHLWSAEDPYLYDLIICCAGEVIRHRFGFREICVDQGVFKINGTPVKLYGVNRHDANPDTGYVTGYEWMKNELLLMKKYNINAIRTAHYPNDPRFYELCNALGFYVMCEADFECHGCTYVDRFDLVTGSEVFAEAIHDRMSRMYESFKNNTSIVIWSLGNESDWGSNLRREMLWFKQVDSRPVHYCEVWRESTWKSLSETEQREVRKNIDIVSVMYPTEELLERYLAFIGNTHALVLAEYSHAMGNSCGDLRFFDDKMEKNPGFAGGFIWEWADHGLRLRDENGKTYFGYGGDFGDVHNMSNVCVDGTVSSDRHPHSSLREAKAVFAPIRITRAENNFEIRNRYSFRNLSALNIHWEKQEEGQITQTGTFSVEAEPGETAVVSSPIGMSAHKADGVLTFRVMDGDREVTAFSFALESPMRQLPTVGHPALFETKSEYIVKAGDVVYRFRKDRGTLTAMSVSGREMLDAPLWWNPYRPFTDNECSPIGDIRMRSCYALTQNRAFGNTEYGEMRVRPFNARQTAEGITISGEFVFAVQGREYLTRGHIDYHINPRGHVTIHQKGIFNPKLPVWLPRYGFCLPLRDNDVKVRYFGLGPKECYEDKSVHAILGRYDYLPDDPEDAYEKPQEFGSRFGVRWVDVENEDMILHVDTDAMAFTVSHLDIHQIGKAAHAKDLISTDKTFLFCDYRMSGVGSNSCGGEPPKEEYRINPGEEYDFCVTLAPEKKEA